MSTAGKVLVVLVLLMVPVWILLVSAVAQLNTEWGQLLAQKQQEYTKLEQDVQQNEKAIRDLNTQITLEQAAMAQHQTVLDAQIINVERTKAEVVAIQAAIKVQLDTLGAEVKTAEAARDLRIAEKEKETKAKADAEKLVAEVGSQNAELLDQLTQLRNDFKSILDSNKSLVEQMLKNRTTQATRTTRPATFVRGR